MSTEAPLCYACAAPATTRCACCGELSCATHIKNVFVRYGDGGANELRCRACFADAEAWNWWGLVATLAAFVTGTVAVLLLLSDR